MARVDELSIEEIRQRYLEKGEPVSAHILTRLQRDPRQGVRQLYAALKKRFERERDERLRLEAMRHFEMVLWKSGVRDIAGVDEVGVGPLAGPVVAAAVMFPPETDIAGVDDSKRLDPGTRATLAEEIRAKASGVGVGTASVEEIDRLNIYHAALLAMQRAVEALDRAYPGYGFATHKGYGTPEHREALLRLGPSAVHRMSFPVIHELRGEFSPLFYMLRSQLEAARTRRALDELEAALRVQAEELAERECRKLRLLVTRRWKLIG